MRIVGLMWLIEDQSQQVFWVELEQANALEVRWTICFGLLAINSSRRERDLRNATVLLNDVTDGE